MVKKNCVRVIKYLSRIGLIILLLGVIVVFFNYILFSLCFILLGTIFLVPSFLYRLENHNDEWFLNYKMKFYGLIMLIIICLISIICYFVDS
jgi:hypothetical protein